MSLGVYQVISTVALHSVQSETKTIKTKTGISVLPLNRRWTTRECVYLVTLVYPVSVLL